MNLTEILKSKYLEFSPDRSPEPVKQGRISPSKVSSGCQLSVYYDLIRADYVEERHSFETAMTLRIGKFVHSCLQETFASYYKELGLSYVSEAKTTIASSCWGSLDGLLYDKNGVATVHEYKTCSQNVMSSLGTKPHSTYYDQVQLYMSAIPNIDHATILYVCRNDFSTREYVVEPDVSRQEELLKIVADIEAAAGKKTPPEPKPIWMGASKCTTSCVYRALCPAANTSKNRRL